ncbi:MAG: D-alanyl-D-alanine carboxypeptidase [Collinsella sp.]|nr:D-alanyl-D-alanine carboxypeptidase [Collinsella sp.]
MLSSRHPWARAAAACALIALLSSPLPAAAEVRDTDIICGVPNTEVERATNDRPDIQAQEAIVVDDEGTVLFERDADKPVKIASVTKVMTAIVALENSDPNATITVDHRAATVGQSSADLKEGDVLTMEEALRALMIPSGNDAAMAIASSVGAMIDPESDDPYGVFIDAMNKKAQELGMANSVFSNPHGLDFDGWEGDFHSTARDVATMFAYAMKNESFRALTSSPDNQITVTGADGTERTIDMIERNTILGQHGNIGGKTGGTYEALQCFVGAFSREPGGEIYTVTLGSDGDEQRWEDTLALANWYYDHVISYPIGTSERTCPDGSPLIARVPHADWTDKGVDVTLKDPGQTVEVFSLSGDLVADLALSPLGGTVAKGDAAGELVIAQNGEEIATAELVAAENQAAPSGIDWLLVQFDRLVRFLTGQPGSAEQRVFVDTVDPLELDAV